MKTITSLSLCCLIILSNCKKESKRLESFQKENDQVMASMTERMHAVPMTEDNDLDFARMMIEHHQGAVDMVDVLVKYSKHDDLKELANKTRSENVSSISRLQQFVNTHGNPAKSADAMTFKTEMDAAMMKMHQSMSGHGYTSDPDLDFAMMMIAHHQGAIDMAKIELARGSDKPAKDEATLITGQEHENMELQSFIDRHGKPQNHRKK